MVCGVRVEDIKEPLMQEIRYLDKSIDELAKGKAMAQADRKAPHTAIDTEAAHAAKNAGLVKESNRALQ